MLLSLGSYPVISLADARQARDEANRLLNGGADPAQERTFHKASSPKDTFRSIANEYVDKLKKEGRADREIDTATILTVLRRAEGSRPI